MSASTTGLSAARRGKPGPGAWTRPAGRLELAHIRHRQGDPRAREELTRATAAWLRADDGLSAVEHGRTLLAMWSSWTEQCEPTVTDDTLAQAVNRRMSALVDWPSYRMTGVV
ncbi:hypothetical protein ABT275_44415 [Streptomyces sp. NPDC001185]|uniref:hypothetical protein n=1 Tax=Streptomyces sp. NPDC001185 TaxID=3154380 RepID=UPI00332CB199